MTTTNESAAAPLPLSSLERPGGMIRFLGTRRARTACALCRWKKVRCDAQKGQPCSNCNFENIECVLVQKRLRRKTTKNTSKAYVSSENASSTDDPNDGLTSRGYNVGQGKMCRPMSPRATINVETPPQISPTPVQGVELLSYSPRPTVQEVHNDIDWQAVAVQSVPLPLSPTPSASHWTSGKPFPRTEKEIAVPSVPYFVKPIPPHLADEDVGYLFRKGALSVPEPALRDALLESYIDYIHPCLPLLDLDCLTSVIQGHVTADRISFPLFQAVMFAGAAWVDIKPLRKLGFLTRKAARKALYRKARASKTQHHGSQGYADGASSYFTIVIMRTIDYASSRHCYS